MSLPKIRSDKAERPALAYVETFPNIQWSVLLFINAGYPASLFHSLCPRTATTARPLVGHRHLHFAGAGNVAVQLTPAGSSSVGLGNTRRTPNVSLAASSTLSITETVAVCTVPTG